MVKLEHQGSCMQHSNAGTPICHVDGGGADGRGSWEQMTGPCLGWRSVLYSRHEDAVLEWHRAWRGRDSGCASETRVCASSLDDITRPEVALSRVCL